MLNESQNRSNDSENLAFSEDSLQRYVKIKKINFLKRLGVLVVLWSLIVAYFVLPISKVGTPSLEGNKNLTINDIIDIAGVRSTDYLWENNTAEQVERLSKHPLIEDVEISVNIFGVHIEIKEKYPLARIQASINCDDIACYNYYLSDLSLISGETVFQSKPLKKAITGMRNLPVLTNIGATILGYVPTALSIALILAIGIFAANTAENAIAKKFPNAKGSAFIVKIAIYVVLAFLCLSQLGIATAIVESTFILIIAAVCIAFAISFGIGGRNFAANTLEKLEKKIDTNSDDKAE